MLSARLYLVQRITALLMAPLVALHLGTMIYATQGGVTAAEILGRTQGSFFWGFVYGFFVLAVSIHAAIGLRVIVYEWLGIVGWKLEWFTYVVALLLVTMGGRTVYAVVLS